MPKPLAPTTVSKELRRTAEELIQDSRQSRTRAQATVQKAKLLAKQVRKHLNKPRRK
jgi:hypothetical protein